MKYRLLYILLILISYNPIIAQSSNISNSHKLDNIHNNSIKVVAHRGDWRNAPENSLPAISYSITMGIDMVEIDIRQTKDGHLVLMHDTSIDRTTKAKGLVKDYTLAQLKELYLVDGIGALTPYKIPTLEEALNLTKGQIMVNLDKSYEIIDKCVAIAKKTNTLDQIVFKANKTRQQFQADWGEYKDIINFMPIIKLTNPNAKEVIKDYIEYGNPFGFETIIPQYTKEVKEILELISIKQIPIWMNSLWDKQNAGHGDEKAMQNNQIYNWYIDNKASYIQTDRPQVLVDYLRTKNLHH